ncbi:serine/threonine-protein kinase EDR1 [Pyrus ussuriensis x Pyrus communis]|uniref:non-specific serine/threonine protein kinase n=1 Tax=Pyrus ussuriensis x Pyrus communis TaxID=2448454 RepID=A0A5N5HMN0_9ROSA|nr:serine/threonine-protein kinase EDR1 [Pyrus ussuriensis x Pyrus communis]
MSKMKHLLRRLHIGGGLNEHQRLAETRPVTSPNTDLNPLASSPASSTGSATMGRIAAVESVSDRTAGGESDVSGSGSGGGVDFNFLEEEFQVQLALAISASDPDSRDDPETAQIDAAKRISLGCSASTVTDTQAPCDMLSLRYWSHNIVDYNEKVVDGFYDVYGMTTNLLRQGKMPLLVDLRAVSVSENVDYDVILVNRLVDPDLQQLEKRAYAVSLEPQISQHGVLLSGLIQKIADIVVDRMGGPVADADEILRRWKVRRYEIRSSMKTIILPLGLIDVGLSRHRALLFKVLADKINLPCMLVKGSYYTGTDDGAVNLIKIDSASEYIIDLMGAPGTLIPAEVPTSQLPNSFFAIRSFQDATELPKDVCLARAEGSGMLAVPSDLDIVSRAGSSRSEEASYAGIQTKDDRRIVVDENQMESSSSDMGTPLRSLRKSCESSSGTTEKATSAQKRKVKNVSKYVISAAKNPEFAQKLHAVLLESGASPPADLFSDMNPQYLHEDKLLGQMNADGKLVDDGIHNYLVQLLSGNELSTQTAAEVSYANFDNLLKQSSLDLAEQRNESETNKFSLLLDTVEEGFVIVSGGTSETTQICNPVLDNPPMNSKAFNEYKESVSKPMDRCNSGLCTSCDSHYERYPALGEVAEWEILWEDLQIGERIGIGSYGEVYHADWNGTEVAVKKFLDQDFSGDALVQFKCEVEIMLRLRHPNVVLFMGAVTRPPHFSILTEFLPRGSLYRLLHRPNSQLDERRRMRMALDVAKGMNYLHTSHPTVVHRDLKSPNLLVDKNWNVKVCDFGLSRTKHHTYLSSKSTAGTPEWMAPEVLRNEPANEKCDVYSFGVILWELATCCIPWKGLNPMQVVGAVGFQNRRLEIPEDIDPVVAEIIRDCWQIEPNLRPSFSQLMVRLRRLQRFVGRTDSTNQMTE